MNSRLWKANSMQIQLKADTKKLTKHLSFIQRKQIPFAAMTALNNVAFDARSLIQKSLTIRLDRPTGKIGKGKGGIIGSVQVEKSNKINLVAAVGFAGRNFGFTQWKETPAVIMARLIKGGTRRPKSSPHLMIPSDTKGGGIKLNKFGNIAGRKAKFQKMLGNKDQFFSGVPIGDYTNKDAGIWERTPRNSKRATGSKAKKWKATGKIVQRVAFEPYTKYQGGKFNLNSIVQKTVARKYAGRFNTALSKALASAK